MKTMKALLLAAMLAGTATAASAQSSDITYTNTDQQAGFDISYSITTNGRIGLLSLADISKSSITFTPTAAAVYKNVGMLTDSNTLYFSNTNLGAVSPVSATATNLFFDFGNGGALNFCAGPLCYALAALGINDEDAVVYDHNDPVTGLPIATRELDNPEATGFRLAANTYTRVMPTVQSFATAAAVTGAVPEPASWAMMVLGVGAAGYAMRRRQKVVVKVTYA